MMGGLAPPDVFTNYRLERFAVIDSDGEARNDTKNVSRVVVAKVAVAVDIHEGGRVAQGLGTSPIPIRCFIIIILASLCFCL